MLHLSYSPGRVQPKANRIGRGGPVAPLVLLNDQKPRRSKGLNTSQPLRDVSRTEGPQLPQLGYEVRLGASLSPASS